MAARGRTSSLGNKYLRKHRKWPISPYKTKWHQTFNQAQALQTLKRRSILLDANGVESPNHLLSVLTHSFNSYDCEPTPQAYHFLIKTSRFDHIPLLLHRIEFVEKFETPEYVFAELIRLYGYAGRFEDAVEVFFRIPNFRCVPSALSLNSLLSVLCRSSEGLGMVPGVLMKSRVLNIRLEESSFRILIAALCRIGRVGCAIEILNCTISDGYDVDMRICSLILSSMSSKQRKRLGLADFEVLSFLEAMKQAGFCPGMMDYSKVIRILVKENRGLDALEVLDKMKAEGMKPDIVCYTMVLNGIIVEGEYGKADELFDELLVLGLVPDVYTYNAYINGLCKQNNVQCGVDMVSRMEELGCNPNSITYNEILKALCRTGELDRAKEYLTEMSLKGVCADLHTYRIMLNGLFGKGEIVEACVLMEEMLDKCLCLRCSTCDEIISRLCQRGLVCRALELLEKMIGKNVAPRARAWEAVVLSAGSEISLPEAIWTGLVNPVETQRSKAAGVVTMI